MALQANELDTECAALSRLHRCARVVQTHGVCTTPPNVCIVLELAVRPLEPSPDSAQ